jgi:hypothetical protein
MNDHQIQVLHYVQSNHPQQNRPNYFRLKKNILLEKKIQLTSVLDISGPFNFHSERISSILAINL